MTAKEMFEALGCVIDIENEYDDNIIYKNVHGNANYYIDFCLIDRTYQTYGFAKGHDINNPIDIKMHKAITQQMKELGWIDETTLEHLFGDNQYDIDKLTLIDDETAYQLYGTEAQHFKNHMAKVAERDLKKYKTDEEDTQSETSLNHMFGNVFEQLDNLKLKKKGEK